MFLLCSVLGNSTRNKCSSSQSCSLDIFWVRSWPISSVFLFALMEEIAPVHDTVSLWLEHSDTLLWWLYRFWNWSYVVSLHFLKSYKSCFVLREIVNGINYENSKIFRYNWRRTQRKCTHLTTLKYFDLTVITDRRSYIYLWVVIPDWSIPLLVGHHFLSLKFLFYKSVT